MGTSNSKETTSDDKGLTAKEQKSNNLGNNDSSNGVSPIIPDQEYILNEKTGERYGGVELRDLANKGKLAKSLQSQLDKTTEAHKNAMAELEQLRKEREQLVVKAAIADSYMSGKTTQQTQEESEIEFDLWADESDQEKKTVTKPVELRNRNSENSSQITEIEKKLSDVNSKIQEIETERRETANAQELERIAKFDSEQNFIALKESLPDIDDTDLRKIIQTENTAERLRIEAMNKRLAGDESWADSLAESRELLAKARKGYVEATKKQETVSIRRDNETSVLGGSPVDGPVQLPEGFKFSNNPELAEKQWKELSEQNKAKSKLKRRSVY